MGVAFSVFNVGSADLPDLKRLYTRRGIVKLVRGPASVPPPSTVTGFRPSSESPALRPGGPARRSPCCILSYQCTDP